MGSDIRDLTTLRFTGPRFEDSGLDLDVLPEILAYKRLLVETAKELWRAENPQRQRLPKGFEDKIRLKFYTIEKGSTTIPIKRVAEADGTQPLFEQPDELDDAAQLIDQAIQAASDDLPLPERFPRDVLPLFVELGQRLGPDEKIELQSRRSATRAIFSSSTRDSIVRALETVYEDIVSIVGEVRAADVDVKSFAIRDDKGLKIPARFTIEQEALITDALRDHSTCRLHIDGVGEFSTRDGTLRKIIRVDHLRRHASAAFDTEVAPIWEVIARLGREIPEAEWNRLPADLAEKLDHYLYGEPPENE